MIMKPCIGFILLLVLAGCGGSELRGTQLSSEVRLYVTHCKEHGITASGTTMWDGCEVTLLDDSEIVKLPASGRIPLFVSVTKCSIGTKEMMLLIRGRLLRTLKFFDCRIDANAIADFKSLSQIDELEFARISLESSASSPSQKVWNPASRFVIQNCDDRCAKALIDQLGFATKNEIKMPRNFDLAISKTRPHVDHLYIVGCHVRFLDDFALSPNLFELNIVATDISGKLVSDALQVKSLLFLGIHNCNISEDELMNIIPPLSVNPKLVIQADSQIANLLREKLPSGIEVNSVYSQKVP